MAPTPSHRPTDGMDARQLREKPARIIGADPMPTQALERLVADFGDHRATVMRPRCDGRHGARATTRSAVTDLEDRRAQQACFEALEDCLTILCHTRRGGPSEWAGIVVELVDADAFARQHDLLVERTASRPPGRQSLDDHVARAASEVQR